MTFDFIVRDGPDVWVDYDKACDALWNLAIKETREKDGLRSIGEALWNFEDNVHAMLEVYSRLSRDPTRVSSAAFEKINEAWSGIGEGSLGAWDI